MTEEEREHEIRRGLEQYFGTGDADGRAARRSAEYDASRREFRAHEEKDEAYRRMVARLVALRPPPADVLEIGSGTGGWCAALALEGYRSTGIEPDAAGVRVSELRALRYPETRQTFRQAVAESLPFPDASFDAVVSTQVLEHLRDRRIALAEMFRVLRPGGVMLHHMPNYAFPYEPHYRMVFPPRAPRWLSRAYLRLRRRSTALFDESIFPTTPRAVLAELRNAGFEEARDANLDELDRRFRDRRFNMPGVTQVASVFARVGALELLRRAVMGLELYPLIVATARKPLGSASLPI